METYESTTTHTFMDFAGFANSRECFDQCFLSFAEFIKTNFWLSTLKLKYINNLTVFMQIVGIFFPMINFESISLFSF